MSYPGNSSLSKEIQERLRNTFQQTLDLASKESREEAKLGCDFILRMDPMFSPARTLMERLNETQGSVEVDDLRPSDDSVPALSSDGSTTETGADLWGEEGNPELSEAIRNLEGQEGMDPSARTMGSSSAPVPPDSIPNPETAGNESDPFALDGPLPTLDDLVNVGDSSPSTPPPIPTLSLDDAPPQPHEATAGKRTGMDPRIQDLLDEGMIAFEQSEYQTAIDAWSRIFLIDVDHAEASRRIEEARRLKAESERQVDEIFHEAMSHFEAGRRQEARQSLERVLSLQPSHLAARDYLDQMDAGTLSAATPGPVDDGALTPGPEPSYPPPVPDLALGDDDLPGFVEDGPATSFDPSSQVKTASKPGRSFVVIGSGVAALVLVGAWFLYSNWGRLFPNSKDAPPAATTSAPKAGGLDPIERAIKVRQGGNTDVAIAQLQKIPQGDANYDKAQLLIGQWEETLAETATAMAAPEGTNEEMATAEIRDAEDALLARRGIFLETAQQAYGENRYLVAAQAFKAANSLRPLEGRVADLYTDTKRQLQPLAREIEFYYEKEWQLVLPALWRKLDEDPDNKDVAYLLANSHYNLGLRALRRYKPAEAVKQFRETVAVSPDDEFAQRMLRFAETYKEYRRDLLYEIYVRHLNFRK